MSVYAESAYEDYRARGDLGGGASLDAFFPNSRTATTGLNWSYDPTLNLTAGLNYYVSGDICGTQWTFNLRKVFSPDHELGIVVAPWSQSDRLYGVSNYRETILSAQYTVKF
jgi:hypothetical protein